MNYSRRTLLFPYRRVLRCAAQQGHTGIIGLFSQVEMQKESPRTRGFEGCYSHYFAGGFALRRCQNSIRRYSTAPKREFRSQFPLFPLDGSGFSVWPFQLRPVFGTVSSRVPPNNTVSCFVGFGDKSRNNFKNYFQTQGFKFLFLLSQSARLAAFGSSIAPKTPVLKPNRPLACKPPAAIVSELTRVALMLVEKTAGRSSSSLTGKASSLRWLAHESNRIRDLGHRRD